MSSQEGVSIIICCYNSASRLKPTLEHITKQQVDINIPWEVIVIDNNSNDNSDEYAKEIWQSLDSNINLRIIKELRQGLSFARETGIRKAEYEYILFCDDDNWLNENYVQKVFGIFEDNPDIGVIGGKGKAVSDVEFPNWFAGVQKFYAVGAQYSETGRTEKKSIYGAGMALKKSIFLDIIMNYQLLLTGRRGNELIAGEDYEICSIIMILGYNIMYNNDLTFAHFIPKERLNKKYFRKIRKGCIESTIYLIPYYHELNNKPISFSWYLLRFIKQFTINLVTNLLFLIRNYNDGLFNLMLIIQEMKTPFKVYQIRKKQFPLKFKNKITEH
jgi:glycosyltransferase involved in cell wall biosynthesis